MAAWTVEAVLALAPDSASAGAGRGLANASKWQSAGANAEAAWGEAKGSGAEPYQTVVALLDGASRCSCPSRKFPCKHALGLLLRYAQGEVAAGATPDWAKEWLEKRAQKAIPKEPSEEKAPKAPNPKTAQKRWDTVLGGLDECEAFLHDTLRNGLLANAAARSWDEMAARMVDAQAPGVARRLRRIGDTVGVGADWSVRAGRELGSLGLLIEAARRADTLGDLEHDVRVALGIPPRKEDAEALIADVWDMVGTLGEEEDRLWTRRSWFRGRESGRWALHLAFSPGGGSPPPSLLPYGAAMRAEARFFPSAWPLRVEMGEGEPREYAPGPGVTWAQALEEQANALALNPWIERFPVLLRDAVLAQDGERWLIVDAEGIGIPLANSEDERHWLLGRTGNVPCEIFGEFDGEAFTLASYRELGT
jgi:hypothetical protein